MQNNDKLTSIIEQASLAVNVPSPVNVSEPAGTGFSPIVESGPEEADVFRFNEGS